MFDNQNGRDIMKEAASTPRGREKFLNLGRKTRLKLAALFLFILFIELEIYEGIVTIKDFIKTETVLNPAAIFAEALRDHPLILLAMIAFDALVMTAVSRAWGGRKGELVDERGIILDNTHAAGASRMMTEKEKRENFTYLDYKHPAGTILGVDKKSKELITTPFENSVFTNRNLALFGPPGMRKSSGVLIPNIYSNIEAGNSIVCTDPKGELYKETYAAARVHGYNIKVFNILGTQFSKSDGWDCLKVIRESANPETEAQMFANILLSNTSSGKANQDFWWDANLNCCMLALLYVAKAEGFVPTTIRTNSSETSSSAKMEQADCRYEKQRTLKEVYALITSPDMKQVIFDAIHNSPKDERLLSSMYNIWAGHKEAESIKSGLGIRLNILNSEEVVNVLSMDQIDFRDLAEKKTIIYIVCADNNDTFKSLLTLFVSFMFIQITAIADSLEGSRLPRPLFIILEECGNIGKIPGLAKNVSTLRSRNIGMLFCFQTLGQMKDIYGAMEGGKYEWETILAGCSIQLCLGGNDKTTSEHFSERSGTMSTISKREGEHRSKLFPEEIQKVAVLDKNVTTTITGRPTLFPDEIQHIKKDEILISPATENVTIENKYFYKHHPLYNAVLIDKETGEIVPEHLTKDRVPPWSEDATPDEERYDAIIAKRPELPGASSGQTGSSPDNGRSYDAFLKRN